MELAIYFIVGFVFMLLICSIFDFISTWQLHKYMVKTHCKHYRYGSFSDFINEFNKVNWVVKFPFHNSLFEDIDPLTSLTSRTLIHLEVIEFNNVGLILNPIDYYRAMTIVRIKITNLMKEV